MKKEPEIVHVTQPNGCDVSFYKCIECGCLYEDECLYCMEDQRIVAEFIGYKLITPEMRKRPKSWTKSYWQKNYPIEQVVLCSENGLMFNKSWEYLILACIKIEDILCNWLIEDEFLLGRFYDKFDTQKALNFGNNKLFVSINIKEVYPEVVKFIKWYNKQKEDAMGKV